MESFKQRISAVRGLRTRKANSGHNSHIDKHIQQPRYVGLQRHAMSS